MLVHSGQNNFVILQFEEEIFFNLNYSPFLIWSLFPHGRLVEWNLVHNTTIHNFLHVCIGREGGSTPTNFVGDIFPAFYRFFDQKHLFSSLQSILITFELAGHCFGIIKLKNNSAKTALFEKWQILPPYFVRVDPPSLPMYRA